MPRSGWRSPEKYRTCNVVTLTWYCDLAESLDPDQGEPIVGEPSPWFTIERENLRVAMAHALKQMPERALRAAVAAWRSWMASGMHAEGLQWLRRALAACSEVSDVHVRALFATAVFEVRLGRIEEAAPLGQIDCRHRAT